MDQTQPEQDAVEQTIEPSPLPSPGELMEMIERDVQRFLQATARSPYRLDYAITAVENALHKLYCQRLRSRQ